jgi:CheY-like chemotaxis protein
LFVEDNAISQKVGEIILKKLGYLVDIVGNGREALERLQTNAYDLVLMDCQMPEMDGFAASAAIRSSNSSTLNPQIPIIAMTARTLMEDRELCMAAGMNDYLSKPVDAEELAIKLKYWIPKASRRITTQSRTGDLIDPKPREAVYESGQGQGTQPVTFNEAELLRRLMDDSELAKKILAAFINELPKQIAVLKQEIINKNTVNTRLHAHSIRGAAANMGAERLREAAREAETLAQTGSLDGIDVALLNIENAFAQFEQAIRTRNGLTCVEGIKQ